MSRCLGPHRPGAPAGATASPHFSDRWLPGFCQGPRRERRNADGGGAAAGVGAAARASSSAAEGRSCSSRTTYRLTSIAPPTCWTRQPGRMSQWWRMSAASFHCEGCTTGTERLASPPAPAHRPEEGERLTRAASAGLSHTGTSTGCNAPEPQGARQEDTRAEQEQSLLFVMSN